MNELYDDGRTRGIDGPVDWARLEAEVRKMLESGLELADRVEAAWDINRVPDSRMPGRPASNRALHHLSRHYPRRRRGHVRRPGTGITGRAGRLVECDLKDEVPGDTPVTSLIWKTSRRLLHSVTIRFKKRTLFMAATTMKLTKTTKTTARALRTGLSKPYTCANACQRNGCTM